MIDDDDHVDNDDMTYSRLAARYLSRFHWYFPQRRQEGDTSRPSLDAAWSHYEHVTLARCYVNNRRGSCTSDDDNNNDNDSNNNDYNYIRASPSEREQRPTKLFPVWATPLQELGQFGLSTQMYFATLLVLSGIMLLTGLLNIPLMFYFWGYAKEDGKSSVDFMGVSKMIRASAICDAYEWVLCETCLENAQQYPDYRLNIDQKLVRRNICNFQDWLGPGLCSFAASLLLLTLVAVALGKQRRAEVVLDEAIQTASDYSIKISNPPPDALDPDEWRQFFNRYACDKNNGVVLVTIALNNADLIKSLIQRRQKYQALLRIVAKETGMQDGQLVSEIVMKRRKSVWDYLPSFVPNAPKLWRDIQALDEKISRLALQKYHAVSVFVTFETERGQRNALHALTTGKLYVWRNQLPEQRSSLFADGILRVKESIRCTNLWDFRELREEKAIKLCNSTDSSVFSDTNLLFRGTHVLSVKEAVEPSDVRWVDLEATGRKRLKYYLASTVGMIIFLRWSGLIIYRLVEYNGLYATVFITMTNCIVPLVCELVNDLESHPTEHGKQLSLCVKITIFRWFNSAIALSVISSFIESISVENDKEAKQETLLYHVYPVMVAELIFNPLILVLDIPENFGKHILAPRARDQEEMNSYFTGARFWLAERYTDMNKVLFVALFFSAILPEAFFLGAMALLAQYIAGKFCVLRLCGPTPDIGFHLARMSRNFFIPLILIAHFVRCSYWWSGYPYDNVCEGSDGGYVYCNQNLFRAGVFPALPRFQPETVHWMSQSQEMLTNLYGWTSVVVVLVATGMALWHMVLPFVQGLYESTYEPDGMDQGIDFSRVKAREEIHGYIPQVKVDGFVFPLLACDLRGVDEDFVSWKDTVNGYERHSLVSDAGQITEGKTAHPIFSIVKQWKNSNETLDNTCWVHPLERSDSRSH